ncbi:hypothetical protein PTTG_28418 [Puccinia triticina 1-1 BBBD Race 1]|uniref:Uncharacterized protein n=1 Tax=Puccinia triticina (isolate 1-1 / race 1 (BBBD)) TaxID=630390 RepID=A0A180GBX3_PUCT1|nr:hypothetical protein PTTG_28418 [Puccinia triticina 1-1 BBBD Race 1]
MVIGIGRVINVIELQDEDNNTVAQHETLVNITSENSPVGINVRVVMNISDAPNELHGGYTPGVHIRFQGYLTANEDDREIMRVEIVSHELVRQG